MKVIKLLLKYIIIIFLTISGVPECILFVTQRLTKYPLLIEPLIKSSRDNPQEQEKLRNALALVKVIIFIIINIIFILFCNVLLSFIY